MLCLLLTIFGGDLTTSRLRAERAVSRLTPFYPMSPRWTADAALPGGNGRPFDWGLARDFHPARPWLLSGGLDPETVEAAIALSGASGVDVSSGVERAPGEKDPVRIRAFVAAARRAFARAAEGVA